MTGMAEEKVSELLADSAKFNAIIDQIEARCMAVDGPVTPTLREAEESELAELWAILQRIRACLRRPTPVAEDVGEWVLVPRDKLQLASDLLNLYRAQAGWRELAVEFAALAASPFQPKAGEDEWRPIDTAPKDGTEVLGCWTRGEAHTKLAYGVIWWHDDSWVEYDTDNRVSDPTHWRPLPVAPAIKREG